MVRQILVTDQPMLTNSNLNFSFPLVSLLIMSTAESNPFIRSLLDRISLISIGTSSPFRFKMCAEEIPMMQTDDINKNNDEENGGFIFLLQ